MQFNLNRIQLSTHFNATNMMTPCRDVLDVSAWQFGSDLGRDLRSKEHMRFGMRKRAMPHYREPNGNHRTLINC